METLKEGFLRKNLGLGDIALIKKWLNKHNITNYTINSDLTIDVDKTVDLSGYKEEYLPNYIQFGVVKGWFMIYNSNIKSLKGCPQKVGGYFDCSNCPKLESLEGAPQKALSFNCNECTNLKSLEGAPQRVGQDFYCCDCPNLKSLEGAPKEVGGNFVCHICGVLFTLDDVKKVSKVKGKISV